MSKCDTTKVGVILVVWYLTIYVVKVFEKNSIHFHTSLTSARSYDWLCKNNHFAQKLANFEWFLVKHGIKNLALIVLKCNWKQANCNNDIFSKKSIPLQNFLFWKNVKIMSLIQVYWIKAFHLDINTIYEK